MGWPGRQTALVWPCAGEMQRNEPEFLISQAEDHSRTLLLMNCGIQASNGTSLSPVPFSMLCIKYRIHIMYHQSYQVCPFKDFWWLFPAYESRHKPPGLAFNMVYELILAYLCGLPVEGLKTCDQTKVGEKYRTQKSHTWVFSARDDLPAVDIW